MARRRPQLDMKSAVSGYIGAYVERREPKAERPGITIRAAADGVAELLLYDEIGFWGITARDFVEQLASIDAATIRVRINSPGGDVFDGLAIYHALASHPATIETQVDGLAASAASFIALAGDKVAMAKNAFMMIHSAWAIVIGNAADLKEMAAILEKVDGQLGAMYAEKSGKTAEEVKAWMDAETWFTADEAKAAGLADEVLEEDGGAAAKAALQRGVFQNAPAALVGDQPSPPPTDRLAAMRRRLEFVQREI